MIYLLDTVAQAMAMNAAVVTQDSIIPEYPVQVAW